jgi:AcrR family transcriptional regulator
MLTISNRKINAQKTKEKLYDCAIELFNVDGYENTSIKDITNKAQIAVGTFYVHYHSKKDLLFYTLVKYDSIAQIAYDNVIHLDSFENQLKAFIIGEYREIKNIGKEILKAIFTENLSEGNSVMVSESRNIHRILNLIIKVGIESGELNPKIPIETYRTIIVTHLAGMDFFWTITDKEQEFEYMNLIIKVMINGLKSL